MDVIQEITDVVNKLNEIYRVANSNKITAENYTQFIDWIKRYIMGN